MKVAIHQPQYFPWSPYVHKAMSADIFVYLDTVQFSKNGVQNRNQIKTPQGAHWLTIPVKHHLGQLLLETRIADPRIGEKHWKTIKANYTKAPGFVRWADELHSLLLTETEHLVDIAIRSTEWMLEKLSVTAQRVRASDIPNISGAGSKLVASICEALKADCYLTGTGALAYLQPSDFAASGCEINVQDWQRLDYDQQYAELGFLPDLSALDLLMNCPDTAAEKIAAAGRWKALESHD